MILTNSCDDGFFINKCFTFPKGQNVSMVRFVSSIVDTGIWPLLLCFWGEAVSQQVSYF
jgi:hypothetical protein